MIGTLVLRRPRSTAVLVAVTIGMLAGSSYADANVPNTASIVDQDQMIERLENSKTAHEAMKEIVVFSKESESNREKIVGDLLKVATKDESLSKRGWAIAALAEIGGQDVDEYLLDVHADTDQKLVVRTWAAAARVSMTRTVNGLIEKANLVPQFPALGRPIGMRIVEKMSADPSKANPEKVMAVTQKVPQLQGSLAPMIIAFGPEKIAKVMVTGKDQNVRRIAAGYLGSVAQQGGAKEVAEVVKKRLAFDAQASEVPWNGGPLFIPGIQWSKENATELVGSMIRWNLWCDVNGKSQEQRQIHNNIRSLGLARAAGYQSPGWNNIDCISWLRAWSKVVGKDGIKKILTEQNVLGTGKYDAAWNGLK